MMMDTTLGIGAADTWTGITTLLVNACLVLRTLRVADTLGTTTRWLTHIFGQARADRLLIQLLALRVGTAG